MLLHFLLTCISVQASLVNDLPNVKNLNPPVRSSLISNDRGNVPFRIKSDLPGKGKKSVKVSAAIIDKPISIDEKKDSSIPDVKTPVSLYKGNYIKLWKFVEGCLDEAMEIFRSLSHLRDMEVIIYEVSKIRRYARSIAKLPTSEDVEKLLMMAEVILDKVKMIKSEPLESVSRRLKRVEELEYNLLEVQNSLQSEEKQ